METGILIGLAVCCFLSDHGEMYSEFADGTGIADIYLYTDFQLIYKVIGIGILVALAFFFLLTYPYYKRKKVRSNVSLANAKQASIAADNTRDVAEANLNNIMRIPMNTKINALDKDFPEPEFDITMDQAILMAQKYRWELVEADYQVRVANENLRSAKAGYMPTVAVNSGYNWKDSDFPGFANKGWSIGGSVSWPIWDGGATQAAIKKAEAGVKVAQEQLLQSRESVELEVRQDYLNILAAKEQIRATEASVAEAEEAYKIAEVRYSSGVGTNLDVLDAELQLSTARTNYISALYNYNIGLATLENAMGIPAVIHPEFAAGSENK